MRASEPGVGDAATQRAKLELGKKAAENHASHVALTSVEQTGDQTVVRGVAYTCTGYESAPYDDDYVVVVDEKPEGNCERIGEVLGRCLRGPRQRCVDLAIERAKEAARDRDATHLLIRAPTFDEGLVVVTGVAYQCFDQPPYQPPRQPPRQPPPKPTRPLGASTEAP